MIRRSDWRRFVERRRRELHDAYPCVMPTSWHWCPKHHVAVPQAKRIPEAWIELSEVRSPGAT